MKTFLKLRLLPFILLSVCAVAGAEKQRDWQSGTVLDSTRSRYFAGTVGNSNTNANAYNNGYSSNTSASETAVYRVYQNFVIEGDQYIYLAQEHLKWRWNKAADVTVNGKTKYAIDKRKLFLIDDEGKEHEMEIVKKTLRLPDK
jgi:hypothetical protein